MTSLEFVKQRILGGYTDLDWTEEEIEAAEVSPFTVFMNEKNMPRTFGEKQEQGFPKVNAKHTPENDFDFFSSETYESDGTLAFFMKAIIDLFVRIDMGSIYNKEKANNDFLENPSDYSVSYEIGDVVVIRRYKLVTNSSGFSFPGERVSICIPIKWDCEKRES